MPDSWLRKAARCGIPTISAAFQGRRQCQLAELGETMVSGAVCRGRAMHGVQLGGSSSAPQSDELQSADRQRDQIQGVS